MSFVRVVLTLLSLTTLAYASGPTAAELKERLHRAELQSSLDADGMPPWHLKLSVQLYDNKGQPTDQAGTIEEWWLGKELRRIVYNLPGSTAIEVRNDKGLYRLGSAPLPLQALLAQIVHPTPEKAEVDDSRPEMEKESFGKVPLECIMLSQPISPTTRIPMGLFPTYCFDPGSDTLRASYNYGSQYILRNAFGVFQGHHVAMSISFKENDLVVATAKLLALNTTPQAAAELDRVENLTPVSTGLATISASVMAGSVINKTAPVYPESARRNRVSGTVFLRAIIGRDGHVHSLHLLKAPDPSLAISAIAAVRQWTYKPYLLNGEATEVDTTITVNYNFSP